MLHARVTRRHTQHLVVAASLIGHAEHPDGATPDDDPGEGRLLHQHEGIERIPIEPEGVVDEAVVVRIARRGEEHAIESNASRLVVHFILVATA